MCKDKRQLYLLGIIIVHLNLIIAIFVLVITTIIFMQLRMTTAIFTFAQMRVKLLSKYTFPMQWQQNSNVRWRNIVTVKPLHKMHCLLHLSTLFQCLGSRRFVMRCVTRYNFCFTTITTTITMMRSDSQWNLHSNACTRNQMLLRTYTNSITSVKESSYSTLKFI